MAPSKIMSCMLASCVRKCNFCVVSRNLLTPNNVIFYGMRKSNEINKRASRFVKYRFLKFITMFLKIL
jgi:biotin synthase-like enzyme